MNNLEVILEEVKRCNDVNILKDLIKYANYRETKEVATARLEYLTK